MAIFTEDRLPEPQRQNLQQFLDSTLSQITKAIAEARNLEAGAVKALIDSAPHRAAQAQSAGLVDQLGYWDQVLQAVETAAGEEAELLSLRDYAQVSDEEAQEGPVIAMVHGLGPIVLGRSADDSAFDDDTLKAIDVAEALAEAIDDPEVAAILFRVDSPGGSYVGSDTIWRQVQRARDQGKPVIVSMGNVAGSGGYFVAAAAHKIVAQPGTLTGSIGVITGKLALDGLWRDLGITWDGVQAGRRANLWSPNAPFSREEWDWLQATLDAIYSDFTEKVAKGRALSPEQVQAAAGGRIWSGEDAMAAGLVDSLGGYRKAIDLAKEAAGIPVDAAIQLRAFPEERDPFAALLQNAMGGEIESSAVVSTIRSLTRLIQALAPLIESLEALTAASRSPTLSTGPLPSSARP